MMNINILFYNSCGWDEIFAVFVNSCVPAVPYRVKMQQLENNLYSCDVNAECYNYVYFTSDNGICTVMTAFSKRCNAFMLNGYSFKGILCLEMYHSKPEIPNIQKVLFDYSKTIKKEVFIWTPKNYDSDSDKKYGVIYMFDGQNLFNENSTGYGCWNVHQIMERTGGYIVVAINNGDIHRDSQLTPNLGCVKKRYEKGFSNGTGECFASFVVNKIIPYINENYNVFTDKEHTAICGSSSGGLESFYMGMEYNNLFGFVGALSPALALFEQPVWRSFLQQFNIESLLNLYMYIGGNDYAEQELRKDVLGMREYLANRLCYEAEFRFDYIENNYHNEACWGGAFIRFADMLK
ncbi:MAG: alpha/beta hydrolase-fold protein [Acutalibacteraceae bacterium]|nr:alpha/beta hydrolase-fold protein [Acutalibacteraceae bacterium]